MRSIFFQLVPVLLATTVCVFNYILLLRFFPVYRRRPIRIFYILASVAAIVTLFFCWGVWPPVEISESIKYVFYVALIWVFGQILLLPLQPIIYIFHRMVSVKERAEPLNDTPTEGLSRRNFLRGVVAAAPLLTMAEAARGIYSAQTEMTVRRYSLSFPELPDELQGFKIGQISDLHLGPYFDMAKLDKAINMVKRENPHLVVVTGDFADDLKLVQPALDRINELWRHIPAGVYFCWGNHDYYHDFSFMIREVTGSRMKLLANSSELIIPGKRPFYLLGVDYPWAAGYYRRGVQIDKKIQAEYFAAANSKLPDNAFKVLIAHHPDSLYDGFEHKIPLTLAGHTHGGQVVLGGKALFQNCHYNRGLYEENGVYGYVSSGIGHWFPFRLDCPPEVSVFTLQKT